MFDSVPGWEGIQQAAAGAGIRLDPGFVYQFPNSSPSMTSFESGRRFAGEILALGKEFTTVVGFDDLTALRGARGFSEAGLRVQDDCPMAGSNNILSAGVVTTGITTIRQPLQEMGLLATECILPAISQGRGRKHREPGRKFYSRDSSYEHRRAGQQHKDAGSEKK